MTTLPSLAPPVTRSVIEDHEWFEREAAVALREMFGIARRLTRHTTDAEDLVADAIAKAWTHRASLQDRSRFRSWVCRILTNCFISGYRSRVTAPAAESLDERDADEAAPFSLFEPLHQPFLLWWGNPEQRFLDGLLREDLERAIDGLPEPFRLAVVMADVNGMSYQEIAETLAIPMGTVRSRLARGRSLLQRALWKHGVDAGLVPHHKIPEAP